MCTNLSFKSVAGPSKLQVVGNIMWVPLFGWWVSLIFVVAAGLLYLTFIGKSYGRLCWKMAKYYIWPFGKFVTEKVRPSSFGKKGVKPD